PSEQWLNSPAWIDGGINPPRFYATQKEINIDRVAFGYPPLPISVSERLVLAPQSALLGPNNAATNTEAAQAACAAALIFLLFNMPEAHSEAAGHLISVTTVYTAIEKPVSATGSHLSRLTVKKSKARTTKSDHIVLEGSARTKFIESFFAVHDLADQYSPGTHSGPPFKFWWTGSSGGKTGATMIDNDHDFEVAVSAILKKKKDTCHVNVEVDLDDIEGFRVRTRKRVSILSMDFIVPRLDAFTEEEQLHGNIIMELKAKYGCERHQGEHGEVGHCFVDASGEHLGLNNRKLKIWAAAIATADATKHRPPNTVEFDGICDGRLAIKPRGRSGPATPVAPAPTPLAPAPSDTTALIMAALVPLIVNNLAPRPVPSADVITSQPTTPARPRHKAQVPMSPTPAVGFEL
ncbi:hypothetical protein BJ138DRAFT_965420, partial [Hygrophoropsis aurantiaca]